MNEQLAEKVVKGAKSGPQALKRGRIFNDFTARVELVPFPFALAHGSPVAQDGASPVSTRVFPQPLKPCQNPGNF
jgi:hypothetical protein